MCLFLLAKADLRKKQKYFSAAHLHFGFESIVMLLLPLSRFPESLCIRVLGILLGLAHGTKRLWRMTLTQMCLSSFLPTLPTASLLPPFSSLLLSLRAWLRSARTHDYWNAVCGSQLRQPWKSLCDVNDGASENLQKAHVCPWNGFNQYWKCIQKEEGINNNTWGSTQKQEANLENVFEVCECFQSSYSKVNICFPTCYFIKRFKWELKCGISPGMCKTKYFSLFYYYLLYLIHLFIKWWKFAQAK